MGDYGPPVDRFLDRAEEPRFGGAWPDYVAEGFGPEHVPDLVRMATDPALNQGDPESREVWAPVHAWRTLGQLRAEEAVGPLAGMLAGLTGDDIDDWVSEELPVVLGTIGPAAVPVAAGLLAGEWTTDQAKMAAGRVLEEVARRHPGARDECVALLSASLERAGTNAPDVNGFLVDNLINLGANEAAGVIERAFAGGFVDDSIVGTWYDVWHDLDLEGEPPPRSERQYRFMQGDPDDPEDDPDDMPEWLRSDPQPSEPWAPTEARSPEERKDRNKARKKLEQKLKGKKGKKR